MKRILTLITLLLLVGCTGATGPVFERHSVIAQNESLVYVYRPSKFDGTTVCFKVYVNDVKQGCLGTNGFLRLSVPPGKTKIKMVAAAVTLEFDSTFVGEKSYYYEYRLADSSLGAEASQWVNALGGMYHVVVATKQAEALRLLAMLNESI